MFFRVHFRIPFKIGQPKKQIVSKTVSHKNKLLLYPDIQVKQQFKSCSCWASRTDHTNSSLNTVVHKDLLDVNLSKSFKGAEVVTLKWQWEGVLLAGENHFHHNRFVAWHLDCETGIPASCAILGKNHGVGEMVTAVSRSKLRLTLRLKQNFTVGVTD